MGNPIPYCRRMESLSMMDENAYLNQVGAELAFAKCMGWDDWTPEEESEEGMVRGFRVQSSRRAPDQRVESAGSRHGESPGRAITLAATRAPSGSGSCGIFQPAFVSLSMPDCVVGCPQRAPLS
jgi:hypothetical protein